ncbi:MAG: sugar transferase [Chloroflexota bacterium]
MLEPTLQPDIVHRGRRSRASGWNSYGLAALDAVLILTAFLLAYWIRYTLGVGPQIQQRASLQSYLPLALLLFATMGAVLFAKGAYRARMSNDVVDEMGTVVSAATLTVGVLVVITTMVHKALYSRGVIVYLWVLLIVLMALGRALFRAAQAHAHRRGWGTRRVLVVGATDAGKMAMQNMRNRPDLGYDLVGFVDHRDAGPVRDFGRFRALGVVADIPRLLATEAVDDVVIALPASAHEEVWPILTLCEHHGVGLKLIPDLFEMSLSRVQVDDIAGIPLLDVQERPLRRIERGAKRIIDIAIASVALVISGPVMCVLMAMIRAESRGPAVLRQERVGLNGRPFTCFKLRTMAENAADLRAALQQYNESEGPVFKMKEDPRRTRVGRRIRAWSLDELPQILNVFRGNMSIVGPRPPLPHEVSEYDPRTMRRLEVKPGMTGIWQVSGRADLPFDEMVLMDMFYVDNWSLALDIRIMIRTVMAVLTRKGAY